MRRFTSLCLALACAFANAQLIDVHGGPLPRHMTALEQAIYRANPPDVRITEAPTGPIWCAAEHEPMEGLIMTWKGLSTWNDIQAQIAREITSADGAARAYFVVDSQNQISSVQSKLQSFGVDLSKVTYIIRTTDSIWVRDYGPRYIYQGGVRSIVDHTYNRPRPNDNAMPLGWSQQRNETLHAIPLRHGGGNFHLDSLDHSFVTRLINNENQNYSEQQIWQLWKDYQNVDTTFFTPFRTSIDSTQHIDMWVQVVSDDTIVISDWPNAPGSYEDNICDAAAAVLQSRGYTVFRTPAVSISGVHYTYTNVVICNDVVLVPTYTNGSGVSQRNTDALATWAAAAPGKRIVGINCQAIVSYAGVMHCIVMHVPRNSRGVSPVAYVTSPNHDVELRPGEQITVTWISDDDVAVTSVEVQLSTDGGRNFSQTLATGRPKNGSYTWTAPSRMIWDARIRVVARDADGRTGTDEADGRIRVRAIFNTTPR